MPTDHVVGAGLAGLAAAATLAGAGRRVVLWEAAGQAGGRCRSYLDAELGCRIDNGNHLLLSGNRSALSYLELVGGRGTLDEHAPVFPFIDLATDERWQVRAGALPRVPGAGLGEWLGSLKLAVAGEAATVSDALPQGELFRRFWEPLAVAALNTRPHEGSARLLRAVVRESFLRGVAACRPMVPREGLSETFVEPALAYLRRQGAEVRFGARLRDLTLAGDRVAAIDVEGQAIALGPGDRLVLAVPPWVAAKLLPQVAAPDAFRAIVNAHYRIDPPAGAPPFIGVIGGAAEWVFAKPGVLSVTVSAAEHLVDRPAEELAPLLWHDTARAYGLAAEGPPAWRIVKEKRATFAATPEQEKRRPEARTRWVNLVLAGDWTRTGLPATIEGAIRSGCHAAATLLQNRTGLAQKALEPLGPPTQGAPGTQS